MMPNNRASTRRKGNYIQRNQLARSWNRAVAYHRSHRPNISNRGELLVGHLTADQSKTVVAVIGVTTQKPGGEIKFYVRPTSTKARNIATTDITFDEPFASVAYGSAIKSAGFAKRCKALCKFYIQDSGNHDASAERDEPLKKQLIYAHKALVYASSNEGTQESADEDNHSSTDEDDDASATVFDDTNDAADIDANDVADNNNNDGLDNDARPVCFVPKSGVTRNALLRSLRVQEEPESNDGDVPGSASHGDNSNIEDQSSRLIVALLRRKLVHQYFSPAFDPKTSTEVKQDYLDDVLANLPTGNIGNDLFTDEELRYFGIGAPSPQIDWYRAVLGVLRGIGLVPINDVGSSSIHTLTATKTRSISLGTYIPRTAFRTMGDAWEEHLELINLSDARRLTNADNRKAYMAYLNAEMGRIRELDMSDAS